MVPTVDMPAGVGSRSADGMIRLHGANVLRKHTWLKPEWSP
jgi:hypothetical protein